MDDDSSKPSNGSVSPPDTSSQSPVLQRPPIEKKYPADPFKQKIFEKMTIASQQRDEFLMQANQQVAFMNGQIQVYKELLDPPEEKVPVGPVATTPTGSPPTEPPVATPPAESSSPPPVKPFPEPSAIVAPSPSPTEPPSDYPLPQLTPEQSV